MSEVNPTTPPESKPTEDAKTTVETVTKAKRWRRRLTTIMVIIVCLVVVFRAAINIVFPIVLRKVAASYGLNAEYDRMDMYVIGGDVGLFGLRFTPTDGKEPVLQAAYCRGSISALQLFRGRLVVERAEAEEAQLNIERLADGSIPLINQLLGSSSTTTPKSTAPSTVTLESPLQIDTFRLQNVRVGLHDKSVAPNLNLTLQMNAMVSGIGSIDRQARFDLQINSKELVSNVNVSGNATSRADKLEANIDLEVDGLRPSAVDGYLQLLGLAGSSSNISLKGTGNIVLKPTNWPATQPSQDPNQPQPKPNAITGSAHLTNVIATADSQPFAQVNNLTIDIKAITPGEFRFNKFAVDTIRAAIFRHEDGTLQIAGLSPSSKTPTTQSIPKMQVATPPATSPANSVSTLPIFSLDLLDIQHADLSFSDRAMPVPVDAAIKLDHFTIDKISTDPADASKVSVIDLAGTAPGLARSFSMTGKALPAATLKTLDLSVKADGINPIAVDPYLAAIGIRRDLIDASFTATFSGNLEITHDTLLASGNISDVAFTDQGRELFATPSASLSDVNIAMDGSKIRLGKVKIAGPRLIAGRSGDGSFHLLGFSTTKPSATKSISNVVSDIPTTAPTTAPANQPINLASLPALEIGELSWDGVALQLSDALSNPPISVTLSDAGVALKDISINFRPGAKPQQGTYRAYLKLANNVESFNATGHVTPGTDRVAFDLSATGDGIAVQTFKPLLQQMGIEPILSSGQFVASANGVVRGLNNVISADLNIDGFQFTDGKTQWASLNAAQISGATFDGKELVIDSIRLDQPKGLLQRDAKGQFAAAGLKLLVSDKPVAPSTQPAIPSVIDLSLPITARLKALTINRSGFTFDDQAIKNSKPITGSADVEIANIALGAIDKPASINIHATLPDLANEVRVSGDLLTSPSEQSTKLTLVATGVTGKAAEAYLPPGMKMDLKDGQFNAIVQARIAKNPAGGSSISASVNNLNWKDAETSLAKVDSALIRINQFDLVGKHIAIDEISATGVSSHASQSADGLRALGFLMRPAPTNLEPVKTTLATPTTQPTADVQQLMAVAKVSAPLITIQKLNLGLDQFSLSVAGIAKELTLSQSSLTNTTPIELLGEDPTSRAPFSLNLSAKINDLVDSAIINTTLAPFAAEPTITAEVNITGIHGAPLTQYIPQLADKFDTSGLSDGRFSASFQSQFGFTRRGLLGIDLSRDINASLGVKDIALRNGNDPTILAGLTELRSDKIKWQPGTSTLSLASLELTKPIGRVVRDQVGIHAMDVTFKLPVASTQPSTQPATLPEATASTLPTTSPAIAVTPPQPAATVAVQASAASSEVRIDKLTIAGADFIIEDRAGDIPTLLPINDLDIEAKGISTRVLTETLPIRFSAIVGAGKVTLPKKPKSVGLLGMLSSTSQPAAPEVEDREIFAQATASGAMVVYPYPKGWTKLSLSSFELASVRGTAKQFGVTLNGGTMDAFVDVKMNGTQDIDARPRLTFTDLSLSEPKGGMIEKKLGLPAPIDVAIQAVQEADGSITLPLQIPLKAGQLQMSTIIGSGVSAVGGVLTKAIIAAPFKIGAGAVAALTGDSDKDRNKDLIPVVITFPQGESHLTPDQIDHLNLLMKQLNDDESIAVTIKNSLGNSDMVTFEARANPSPEEAAALASRLRQDKQDLQQKSTELSGQLRVALATQNKLQTDALVAAIQSNARQLGDTESAMDELYALTRKGADKQAPRRTRAAALIVGQQRVDEVKAFLINSKLKAANDRIAAEAVKPAPSDNPTGTVTIELRRIAKN